MARICRPVWRAGGKSVRPKHSERDRRRGPWRGSQGVPSRPAGHTVRTKEGSQTSYTTCASLCVAAGGHLVFLLLLWGWGIRHHPEGACTMAEAEEHHKACAALEGATWTWLIPSTSIYWPVHVSYLAHAILRIQESMCNPTYIWKENRNVEEKKSITPTPGNPILSSTVTRCGGALL